MPQLSQPIHEFALNRDALCIPMRDGVHLMADLYLPAGPGPWPVLLERTPYNKENSVELQVGSPAFFASRGYAVVIQDVRGRFKSDGEFYPFRDDGWGEHQDGYDTVEWLAAQEWCNGKVGTMGGSYSGNTQYSLSPTQPPHLVCQFIREQTCVARNGLAYRGGAFELGLMLGWATIVNQQNLPHHLTEEQAAESRALVDKAMQELDEWYKWMPLSSLPLLDGLAPWYYDYLDNPTDGPFWWRDDAATQYANFSAPIYHMGGWYDLYAQCMLDNYMGVVREAKSEHVRKNQKLIVGPWLHGTARTIESQIGEFDFGPEAILNHNEMRLPWFDHWIKGLDSGVMDEPNVRFFTMGINRWQSADTWPPPGITPVPFYFQAGTSGSTQSLNDGRLGLATPGEATAADSYEYDPANPVATLGGSLIEYSGRPWGPCDQRPVEGGVLTYTSDPLQADLEVTGQITAILFASSSAPDTDWVVRLCDVSPAGVSKNITDGILRARYRESQQHPKLLTPNEVYRFEVDMWSTSNVFLQGHRIRIAVTSSSYPRWDRNLNTGGPLGLETEGQVALNTILRDALHPSHVVLSTRGGQPRF